MRINTADLCDSLGDAAQVCTSNWRSYGGSPTVSGRVQTLRAHEDAALIRQTLATPGLGRVLVVDAGASLRVAVLGDNMARTGLANGWAGVIIEGAVRDVQILRSLDMGIFALGQTPLRAGRTGWGELGVILNIAGIRIRPGASITVDMDGAVVTEG